MGPRDSKDRSDDGVGVFVAQTLKAQLEEQPNSRVRLFDAGTGGVEVMFHARGADALIIVGASLSGSPPGDIFSLYLTRELCEAYFEGTDAVALLARDGAILIVPLARASSGGLLLKQRNLRGDRVIHAQEFLRDKGIVERFEAQKVAVRWDPVHAALAIDGLLRLIASM